MTSLIKKSLNELVAANQYREVDAGAETYKRYAPPNTSSTLVRVEPPSKPAEKSEDEAEAEEQLQPEEEKKESQPKNKNRKKFIFLGLGALAIVGSVFGVHWWQYASTHESTDDAYVTADIHPVSSRVNGTVTKVLVNDNQYVQAGQLVVALDPRDYQVQVLQAKASLESAQRQASAALSQIEQASETALGNTQQAQGNVGSAKASISTAIAAVKAAQAAVPVAQAQVAQADANLSKAQSDYKSYNTLYNQGAIPLQQLNAYKATYQVNLAQKSSAVQQVAQAQANLAQAQENVTKVQAQFAASQGGLKQAQATGVQTKVYQAQYQAALGAIAQSTANLKNAELQLSYTNIYASAPGQVGNKTAQVGQRVQPGTPLMAISQNDDWIVANFKETQLAHMRIGQKVEVKIDSIPGHTFIGHVNSLSPGTGATYALLPSDNATGNFTKIVQRVPVKIVFDPQSIRGYESRIVPGLSVETSVVVKE